MTTYNDNRSGEARPHHFTRQSDESGAGDKRLSLNELPEGTRPQNRLLRDGAGVLSEAELIALVLGGNKALETAYEIVKDCGRVDYLTRYEAHQLAQLDGVGLALACRLLAAVELGRRVTRPREMDIGARVSSPSDAANLLMPDMMGLAQEELRVILLDTRNRVLGVKTIYKGSLNTSVVRMAEIIRPAIVNSAAAMIVAHNHPSGDPSPSPDDIRTTRELVQIGKLLDVPVLDHLIIGMGRYVSLAERGFVSDAAASGSTWGVS
jgi:DNA repair protein RadC